MLRLRARSKITRRGVVSKSHYITIPSDVVRALGWREGDVLAINITPLNTGGRAVVGLLIYKIGD